MTEDDFATFLRDVLPKLGLLQSGFRNVKGTVKKRLRRRVAELGVSDLDGYRAYLASHPGEWATLDAMCRIPISRVYRDAFVYDRVARELLPERARAALVEGRDTVSVWSAGCASGEEPYTIAAVWHLDVGPMFRGIGIDIVATDVSAEMCERVRRRPYDATSLREVPEHWRTRAFTRDGALWTASPELCDGLSIVQEDLRTTCRPGPFDLIFCRNLAFTYFDEPHQRRVAEAFTERLRPGGFLVIGNREVIPEGTLTSVAPSIYRR